VSRAWSRGVGWITGVFKEICNVLHCKEAGQSLVTGQRIEEGSWQVCG
jgi:hypothetical protein